MHDAPQVQITWTPELLQQLKRVYANALDNGRESFVFDGHGLLTGYAKYLIEYLEQRFNAN